MLGGVQFGSLWRWNICWCFLRPKTNESDCSHGATSLAPNSQHLQYELDLSRPFKVVDINLPFYWMDIKTLCYETCCLPPCSVSFVVKSEMTVLCVRLRPRSVYPQTASLTPVRSTPMALSSDYRRPVFIFIYTMYESGGKGTGVKNKALFFHCIDSPTVFI